jgi:DNA ligase-4
MGFNFSFLCDLLSDLDGNRVAKALAVKKDGPDIRTIGQWFARHDRHIHHKDTDRLALLSCMFPDKRTDRVYWLQATSLARVIARCLGLGSSRLAELDQWRNSGGPDLGQCVENVMRQAENDIDPNREVTVEEIDMALSMIASRCRFSGPEVRRQKTAVDVEGALLPLYRRLSSRDAKWLTRMILKSYPVVLPPKYTLDRFHFLLPYLLQFQDTFEGALHILSSEPINKFPTRPDPRLASSLCSIAMDYLRPRPGIKIGRPEYYKARSIKHCYQMVKGRRMSIERKYDGEYCQIHIDLTNKQTPVRIFSKSGKDSTADRFGIIATLEESLRMGTANCKFARHCILEGELLVWNEKKGVIADFHKLRKFLPRSGTYLGVDSDSPYGYKCSQSMKFANMNRPQPYEHLMIVFFDILLLDEDVCLKEPHRERRLRLQDVVQEIHGRAAISEQEVLDFNQSDSVDRLEVNFAHAISKRWEGCILKACGEPYFPMYSAGVDTTFGRWIKLKKDYIPGLGDTVDLALIGGYYDAHDAAASSARLRWTHLLVGCLLNKEKVELSKAVPHFRVVDAVDHHCMHRDILQYFNQVGEFYACNPEGFEGFGVEYGHSGLPQVSSLFKKPFVVEMMGSGFEKPSNARYFTLRFPRILKVHTDRTFLDAASHRELQLLAEDARSIPEDDLSQEREEWRKRLKVGNGRTQYIVQRSQSPSSRSSSVGSDPNSQATDLSNTSQYEYVPDLLRAGGHSPNRCADPGRPPIPRRANVPAVHIDETIFPEKFESITRDGVLAENENLSSRQTSSQAEVTFLRTPVKHGIPLSDNVRMKAKPAVIPTSLQPSDTVSTRHIKGQDPGSMAPSSNENKIPQSPLTTVPVYLSDIPSGLSPKQESPGLHEFLQALGSTKSRSTLQQSNPKAVSKGIALGIVLVRPRGSILGQEILQIARFLQRFRANQKCPPSGRIFFLNSDIVKQDVQPEDSRFCLRDTWADLGRKYHYACLHWDMCPKLNSRELGRHVGSHDQLKSRYKSSGPGRLPPVTVSFAQTEILALGEYKSISPLLHYDD